MTTQSIRLDRATDPRVMALIAGVALLILAVLGPFAFFVVLGDLVVDGDAAATTQNIDESEALFRSGIAAFLVVIAFDVVIAWAFYVLLRPVHPTLSLLVGWLRLAYAAVFAVAISHLFDVAELLDANATAVLDGQQLSDQVMLSIASFENGWSLALGLFGLHLIGLGVLLGRSAAFPTLLGILVVVAGAGYVVDTFGAILIAGYSLNLSAVTFVGEALLIIWLFWRAAKGFPRTHSADEVRPTAQPEAM